MNGVSSTAKIARVVGMIQADTGMSVQEAFSAFYNSPVYADLETESTNAGGSLLLNCTAISSCADGFRPVCLRALGTPPLRFFGRLCEFLRQECEL